MKSKVTKTISIICSAIGFIVSLFALWFGLGSINASGLDRIGTIFIMPAIVALIIIIIDFKISIDKIKRGLVYSILSSLLKIGLIIALIPSTIYDYRYEMEFGVSNFGFDMMLIAILFIVAIPSVLNVIKLSKARKED